MLPAALPSPAPCLPAACSREAVRGSPPPQVPPQPHALWGWGTGTLGSCHGRGCGQEHLHLLFQFILEDNICSCSQVSRRAKFSISPRSQPYIRAAQHGMLCPCSKAAGDRLLRWVCDPSTPPLAWDICPVLLPLTDHPGIGPSQGQHQPGEGERPDESGAEKVTSLLPEGVLRLPSRSTARALHRCASFGAANGRK